VVALDINCEELGLFPYELRLRALPASAEKTTRVVAVLGGSTIFSLTVSNHAQKTAVFAIKVSVCHQNVPSFSFVTTLDERVSFSF